MRFAYCALHATLALPVSINAKARGTTEPAREDMHAERRSRVHRHRNSCGRARVSPRGSLRGAALQAVRASVPALHGDGAFPDPGEAGRETGPGAEGQVRKPVLLG